MSKKCITEGFCTTLFLTAAAAAILGQVCVLAAGAEGGIEMAIAGVAVAATIFGLSHAHLRPQATRARTDFAPQQ